jgi:2-dehydropantoate 2-reductase
MAQTAASEKPLRLAMVGCGGVGGVVAAKLVGAGHHVVGITHRQAIADAIANDGLVSLDEGQSLKVRFDAVPTPAELKQPQGFDIAFLATPPDQAVDMAEAMVPHLKDGAPLVCFPNGLIEERVAARIGSGRIIGGIVAFGASMLAPGQVERTSSGGFVVGRLDGGSDATVDQVAQVLQAAGPVETTENLRGARWSKLAINCAISSLGTIGGNRLGALMRHRFVRRLTLEVMTEVVQVALAEGVSLEKVSGTLDLEWLALDDEERLKMGSPSLLTKHAVLLAVGAKYRRLRSSMLAAIERGRKPPVDFLNGEIVSRAQKHGLVASINQRALEDVWAISRGDKKAGLSTLRQLFDETRPILRARQMVA